MFLNTFGIYMCVCVCVCVCVYTSLVVQSVKNLTAVQETWVQSLGWKIPGEGNGNSLKYSCLENSMDRGAWQLVDHGVTKSQKGQSD